MSERRKQVAQQCKVVAHLATAIAKVYSDYERLFSEGNPVMDDLTDQIGRATAGLMENLGNVLNGMDSVTEEDDWTHPIFREAQRLWPPPNPHQ